MQSNLLKLLIILFLVISLAACGQADGPDLKAQIEKTKKNIVSLKQDRDKKVLPLEMNYMQMHDQYYPYLTQKLPEIGIRNHEELLKNCEQYLELCSLLNRVAKLQYYISKLDDKLKQIGANIIKLDDNVWNMERTLELAQIFSDEELESVEQLIEETKGKIDSQVGTTGCGETVYISTDHGTKSIQVISDFLFYLLWIISGIPLFAYFYFLIKLDNKSPMDYVNVFGVGFSFIVLLTLLSTYDPGVTGLFNRSQFLANSELVNAKKTYEEKSQLEQLELNKKKYQQRQLLGENGYNLKIQIEKAKQNIASLKEDREQKVLPLKQNYSRMYDQYYPQLSQQLPETGIRNHEELLKNCEQYLELCSSLNRVAKLQYYIGKLDDKLKQIGANIIKLDDNVWNMERTFELSQIFSDEELGLFWFLCGNEVYTDSLFNQIVLKVFPSKHFTN